ncbi:hypothetical protein GGH19_000330 [Coemansia sp. RSA 1807]|nr:hypothetical protein GGF48_000479 [Coemansia sp. RSA 921]KAJ2180862.1 hypothetical protein GGF45_001797 [Coemansia sp. RSA 551]KAJ2188467.1 hypothetical protein EV181_002181 [Coemansia sp. RSA 532]KAJ2195950.1 hypothetical protein IW144_003191 [Coemansia sp. RSA 522]KAJ2221869.1 hypothetical protein IW143_001652 [Coemansia sp. RSA 520]KAJ2273186.1 hypothetical protein J3F81_002754 [Coemansia sp. RSA 371]KAJ2281833.1 hypothetical protein EV176_000199 [Coemansia sp. RSA 451]KAJ2289452.1 hyp
MLQKYASFVVNNAAQVNSIENGLRTLTYVLPGRFADAELASEAIYTLLSFVGVYHDKLLAQAAIKGLLVDKQGQPLKLDPTVFNRYHGQMAHASDVYRVAAHVLSCVQYAEKLVEMVAAKRLGNRRRWQVVTWIEITKVVLRLALLRASGQRMVTGAVVPEREVDPGSLGSTKHMEQGVDAKKQWKGGRSRLSFTSVREILQQAEGNADLGAFVANSPQNAERIAPASSLMHRLNALGLTGELLFILRPLIYVLSMRKLGANNWRAWALSLLIELTSRQMLRSDINVPRTLERDEMARRKWLFVYYLVRMPFFEQFTEKRLSRVAMWCSNKPVISLLGSLIQDYQPLWKQYYFYTAGS